MDDPSPRLLDQRIRNRIMDALDMLGDGDEGVRVMGPGEFFESYYDWVPHRDSDGDPRPNAAITPTEWSAIQDVSNVLDDACDATQGTRTADELIASGWPARIQPVARKALALMEARGRFSDDREEDEPRDKGGSPPVP